MDALEKQHLREKMAVKMSGFLENSETAFCVSGHWYQEPQSCELCQSPHAQEIMVIKNRSGKKMKVGLPCLKEMVRFRVVEVEDLPRWIKRLPEIRSESIRREEQLALQRADERKRLEKRVIVRKKKPS